MRYSYLTHRPKHIIHLCCVPEVCTAAQQSKHTTSGLIAHCNLERPNALTILLVRLESGLQEKLTELEFEAAIYSRAAGKGNSGDLKEFVIL